MTVLDLADEEQTQAAGAVLAGHCRGGGVIYLRGELGAGKTTFVRGVLRGLGHAGTVKSPTFTLVEDYGLAGRRVLHFDLYRLNDAQELEFLGIRDYLDPTALWLIEWPERGQPLLPPPDLSLDFAYRGTGRRLTATAETPKGQVMAAALTER